MTIRTIIAAASLAVFAAVLLSSGAYAAQAAARSPLELRSGPGGSYDVVGTLGAGAIVNVLWCGTKQNWCLIQRHGAQGWVSLGELQAQAGGSAATDAAAVFPSMPGSQGGASASPIKQNVLTQAVTLPGGGGTKTTGVLMTTIRPTSH